MASKMFRGQFGVALIPDVIEEAKALEEKYRGLQNEIEKIEDDLRIQNLFSQGIATSIEVSFTIGKPDADREELLRKHEPIQREMIQLKRRLKKATKKLFRTRQEIQAFLTTSVGFEAADVGSRMHRAVGKQLDELANVAGIY